MASITTGHDHESRLLEEAADPHANIYNNKGGSHGGAGGAGGLSKDMRHGHGRTAHNMSSSSLRKKSDLSLVSKVRCTVLRGFLATLQEIFLGTKLFVLFPAVPLAIAAHYYHLGRVSIFFFFSFSFLVDLWLSFFLSFGGLDLDLYVVNVGMGFCFEFAWIDTAG